MLLEIDLEESEAQLEKVLAEYLSCRGLKAQRQVSCTAGIADLIAGDCLYELKFRLTRPLFFQAVGQVLSYRAAFAMQGRSYQAIVAGLTDAEPDTLPVAEVGTLGVQVLFCDSIWRFAAIVRLARESMTEFPGATGPLRHFADTLAKVTRIDTPLLLEEG